MRRRAQGGPARPTASHWRTAPPAGHGGTPAYRSSIDTATKSCSGSPSAGAYATMLQLAIKRAGLTFPRRQGGFHLFCHTYGTWQP
jgi:hypothetical protein